MSTAVVWFRRDLRLADHAALRAALEDHSRLVLIYIHDLASEGTWAAGAAGLCWLERSLVALSDACAQCGAQLHLASGDVADVLASVAASVGATQVYAGVLYEPAQRALEQRVEQALAVRSVGIQWFAADLLHQPQTVRNRSGGVFKVFTPFYKHWLFELHEASPLAEPSVIPTAAFTLPDKWVMKLPLLPPHPWMKKMAPYWQPGAAGGMTQLCQIGGALLRGYSATRDVPGVEGTSKLSPHLHFGEITPRMIVHYLRTEAMDARAREQAAVYIRQLAWRDFAHYVLYHFPHTTDAPMDGRFSKFPWCKDCEIKLLKWQRGQTGIPLVDAGMRELWETGWMHNRVRMVVASLLTKNLLVPWQLGARWFWDTLVDADLANNSMGWQWVAGCGVDAAPYFRVFNPVSQSKRFDANGAYIRRWVPELARLPDAFIHAPWEASDVMLHQAGIVLGKTYPLPVVDPKTSREAALAAYRAML
jgi:deoxyribodipyrimidine photo-lyase